MSTATIVTTPAAPSPLDEWKECRLTIDRFDKLLLDLRKTGSALITAFIAGSALLLARVEFGAQGDPNQIAAVADQITAVKVAVVAAVMIMILAIFTYDRLLSTYLEAAVKRAEELEKLLKFALTTKISMRGTLTRSWIAASTMYGAYYIAAGWIMYSVVPSLGRLMIGAYIAVGVIAFVILPKADSYYRAREETAKAVELKERNDYWEKERDV